MNLRHHYFLPDEEGAVELRAFTHGLMPRRVPEMLQHFADDWRRRGVDAWNEVPNHWLPDSGESVGWWTLPEYLGDRFIAPLIGAPNGSCILLSNVHQIVQALLSCPETGVTGRKIVTTALEFPSVLHTMKRWEDVYRTEVTIVPATDAGFVDEHRLLDAIDDTTALVVVSHVGFRSGERLTDSSLRLLAQRVHAVGGLLAIDGYHATGSIDVDVASLDVDVYFGGLLKEASGSSGNAYLYVRPGLDLSPRSSGWFGDAQPFDFSTRPEDHPSVRRRFLGGTFPVAPLYHAVEGVRLLLDAGLAAVREDSLEKTQQCLNLAERAGLQVTSPPERERRGAMIILKIDGADRLCSYLKTRGVYTDSRVNRYLRLAPFVWNTSDEVEKAFEEIERALRTGAHFDIHPRDTGGPVT